MDEIKVNDGGGLYTNEGLVDTIIADYNTLPRLLVENQFIKAAALYASVAQRLANLKKGIKVDMDSMKAKVEELKAMNESLKKDGGNNGAD